MASSLIGIQVPGNRLWVRVPCPPLLLFTALSCSSSIDYLLLRCSYGEPHSARRLQRRARLLDSL